MSRRRVQKTLAALAFAAAAGCFVLGLAGLFGSWFAAMVASLALLTIGFFLASRGSAGD
jgi:hypothetical protein